MKIKIIMEPVSDDTATACFLCGSRSHGVHGDADGFFIIKGARPSISTVAGLSHVRFSTTYCSICYRYLLSNAKEKYPELAKSDRGHSLGSVLGLSNKRKYKITGAILTVDEAPKHFDILREFHPQTSDEKREFEVWRSRRPRQIDNLWSKGK